jgi:hypothetical protein
LPAAAIRIEPDFAEAHSNLGGALLKMGRTETDPALARAAADLAPGEISPVVPIRAGLAILRRQPRDFRYQAGSHVESGASLLQKGDLEGAIREWKRRAEYQP